VIDFTDRVVYEIKPSRMKDIYVLQLSAYVEMAEALYGGEWSGKFILYNSDMQYVVQDFFSKKGVLKKLDWVVEAKTLVHASGRKVLRKSFCSMCKKRVACPLVLSNVKWMVV